MPLPFWGPSAALMFLRQTGQAGRLPYLVRSPQHSQATRGRMTCRKFIS